MSLAIIGYEVVALFTGLRSTTIVGQNHVSDINHTRKQQIATESDRFELWATNLGLFLSGHGSLDYRVRGADSLRVTLSIFLSDLKEAVAAVLRYLNTGTAELAVAGPPPLWQSLEVANNLGMLDEDEDEDEDGLDGSADGIDIELLMENLRDPLDRLYKLSTAIRKPSSRFESSRATRYKKIDPDSGVDLLKALEPFDLDYVSSTFLQFRKVAALENEPATKPQSIENEDENPDEVWEPIRTVLAQHKLKSVAGNESFLVKRIAHANGRRRRLFAYWISQRENLREQRTVPRRQTIVGAMSSTAVSQAPPTGSQAPTALVGPSVTSINGPALTQPPIRDDRSAMSVSEYAPSTQARMDTVEFPTAPKREPDSKYFECPFCFTICSVAFLKPGAWKAHVIRDLHPYTCTYELCRTPDQLYNNRNDWIEHENTHRRVWRCPEHQSDPFTTIEDYRHHFQSYHGDLDSTLFKMLLQASESTTFSPDRPCPICWFSASTLKELQNHVALHLERLSLFSLPRSSIFDEDDLDVNEAGSQNVNAADMSSATSDMEEEAETVEDNWRAISSAARAKYSWNRVLDKVCESVGIDRGRICSIYAPQSPLLAMRSTARTYLEQGRMSDARALFLEILEVRRRAFGESHTRTIASLKDLAAAHEIEGQPGEAEAIQRQLAGLEAATGESIEQERLIETANLAVPYRNQGDLQEAEALERRLRDLGGLDISSMGDIPQRQTAPVPAIPKDNQTLLFEAVRTGNEQRVRTFLETEEVDPDSRDFNNRSPLSWAAGFGNESMVALLLSYPLVDPDSKDCRGQTPLSWAADCGHDRVVKLLLNNDRVDPDSKDASGWTPLAWAASKGYGAVVELLLNDRRVDADSRSHSGLTPLAWAVDNGYHDVVKLLLESGRVDATFKDAQEQDLIDYAEKHGNDDIAELLAAHGARDVHIGFGM